MTKFYGYEDRESIKILKYTKMKIALAIIIPISLMISSIFIIFKLYLFVAIVIVLSVFFLSVLCRHYKDEYIKRYWKHNLNCRHIFYTEKGELYIDNEKVKNSNIIKLYEYKGALCPSERILILKIDKKEYLVEYSDYMIGSVYTFLNEVTYVSFMKAKIEIILPRMGKEEKPKLLFNHSTLRNGAVKIWYSKGLHKRIYIYKKENGKYGHVTELLFLCDEWQQKEKGVYGYWFISKESQVDYDTLEEAHKAVNHQTKRMILREDFFQKVQ